MEEVNDPSKAVDAEHNDEQLEPLKRPAKAIKAKAKSKAAAKKLPKAMKVTTAKPKEKDDDDEKKDETAAGKASKKAVASKPAAKPKAKPNAKPNAKPKPAPKKAAPVRDLKRRLMEGANNAFKQEETHDADDDDDDAGEIGDDEDDGEKTDKRDRCKKHKFEALMKQGKLPANIIKQYEDGIATNKQQRKFKTQFVNTLFERDAKGKLVMMPNAPMFQAWKETSTRLNFHDKQTGLPKRVFMGTYFGNSEEALNEAIAADEVQVMKYDGSDWYVFRTLKLDQIQGKSHDQKLLVAEKGLDKGGCKQIVDAFDSVNFDFGTYMIDKPSILSTSSSSKQLAIADAPKGVMHTTNVK